MRTKPTSVIIAAVCGLLLAGCCTDRHHAQWEYKVEKIPNPGGPGGPQAFLQNQEALLNGLGKEGWVLVTEEGGVYYLKRKL